MKSVLAALLVIGVLIGAGYFGLPFLIEKKIAGLRSEVEDLKQRLQKMELESKAAPLPPEADAGKIIKTVNAISLKTTSLEASLEREKSALEDSLKRQKMSTEETLKKQAETAEKNYRETVSRIEGINFGAAMAGIRAHILKARFEIGTKNLGTAKAELEFIDELLRDAAGSVSGERKRVLQDLQSTLKKARTEIDTDLPSATNKIELLWHEISQLIRTGRPHEAA
jgi:hypothetical protein